MFEFRWPIYFFGYELCYKNSSANRCCAQTLARVHFFSTDGMFHSKDTALFILELIDLTLIGSLVAMVAIAGYENFVSRIDFKSDLERPEWMGKVDFAGLKLKVISALVAISSIELLKVFLNSGSYEEGEIMWRVIIHSVFVASGFIFALTEKFMPHK